MIPMSFVDLFRSVCLARSPDSVGALRERLKDAPERPSTRMHVMLVHSTIVFKPRSLSHALEP